MKEGLDLCDSKATNKWTAKSGNGWMGHVLTAPSPKMLPNIKGFPE